ncbi:MAG: hypothetical protein ACJ72Z_12130 [Pyrinomonadaceae bacterium]
MKGRWLKIKEQFEQTNEEIAGKVVERIIRQFPKVISIVFSDGSGLYVDGEGDRIELLVSPIENQKPPDEELFSHA